MDEPKTKISRKHLWESEYRSRVEGALDSSSSGSNKPEQARAYNLKHQSGPLGKEEYAQVYKRSDVFNETEFQQEEAALVMELIDEVVAQPHEACVQAAKEAWATARHPFIDAHFSLWNLSLSEINDGSRIPPKTNSKPWQVDQGQRALKLLQRHYTVDNYDEQLEQCRMQAEAEMADSLGDLGPIRYGIHVQVSPCYSDNLHISNMAEEYPFIAGYVSWADLDDEDLNSHILDLMRDPYLVALRYDLTGKSSEWILSQRVHANIASIEVNGLPFELQIGPHQLREACHLAHHHPTLKFILNHAGMPLEYCATESALDINSQIFDNWRADLQFLSRYPNVHCKLTGATGWSKKREKTHSAVSLVNYDEDEEEREKDEDTSKDYNVLEDFTAKACLIHALTSFGVDRCIFGSGWPVSRVCRPEETAWRDCSIRRLLTSSMVDETKAAQAKRYHHEYLDVWETSRLVEHCIEEAGFGSREDKEKIFGSNSHDLYRLQLRPYGMNNK